MALFQTSRFSRTAELSSVRLTLLRRFLKPFAGYLRAQGFEVLQETVESDGKELERLSSILMDPADDAPHELVEALFCVQETAVPANADLLEITAASEGVSVDGQSSLLELALSIWLGNPEALKRLHHRQVASRVRSFEYFSSEEDEAPSFEINTERLAQLERSLSIYFEKKKRGYGCRIHHYSFDKEEWFLVSHGELVRRETTWEAARTGVIAYRPGRYDLVVYDAITEELRINAGSVSLREHYRKQFGFYLFGRENYFPGKSKYSLEPILQNGAECLFTDDVPGLESAKLTELTYAVDDGTREVRSHKAPDLFAAFDQHKDRVLPQNRLLKASFAIQFSGATRPRTLTIKPGGCDFMIRSCLPATYGFLGFAP